MLKLNASYSKKVPVDGQDYSSHSYHASVEVELPDGLTAEQLQSRIHETFSLVRQSVDDELHGSGGTAESNPPTAARTPVQKEAMASAKQLKFLADIALQRGQDIARLNSEAHRRFGAADIHRLTRQQASWLIDELSGKTDLSQRRAA